MQSRRSFLRSGAAATLASPLALNSGLSAEMFDRVGPPRLRLAIAGYSFRDVFNAPNPAERWSLEDFINYCARHGVEGAELTSYYFKDTSRERALEIRRHAFIQGVSISGTAVGNTFTLPQGPKRDQQMKAVKLWIDRANDLGASHVRVFAGNLEGAGFPEAKRRCVESLKECCDYAGERGVFLGIENHGGIVSEADALLEIVDAVPSPWLGINLDTGNFHTDAPYDDLAKCAPFAVNVQLKVEIQPRGEARRLADLPRLIRILKAANYRGFVALEHERAGEDPRATIPAYLSELRPLL